MSAPSRPVVVVLEGISAGQYFADAALKRDLNPLSSFLNCKRLPSTKSCVNPPLSFGKTKAVG